MGVERGEGRPDVGFFFQAEDGIRDRNVTGVQTCALPISSNFSLPSFASTRLMSASAFVNSLSSLARSAAKSIRSEERRVGKECTHAWRAARRTKQHSRYSPRYPPKQ